MTTTADATLERESIPLHWSERVWAANARARAMKRDLPPCPVRMSGKHDAWLGVSKGDAAKRPSLTDLERPEVLPVICCAACGQEWAVPEE